jgi:hypothetical protein
MDYTDLIAVFKNANKASEKIGFSRQAISKWKKQGRIPLGSQYVIQLRTNGRLRADRQIDRKAS